MNKEWFDGRSVDESCQTKRAVFWLAAVCAIFLAAGGVSAYAEPMFQVVGRDGAVVVLHSEPCQLKEIDNLKGRATWSEAGKTYEGCWGRSALPVVVLYFSDRTVVVIPAQAFERVTGA